MEIIKISNLNKAYKDTKAINDLSLEIQENELFALLGVNGAGKSTLVNILSCIINKDSGVVIIDGKNIDKDRDDIKEIINTSPQETAVAPNLTVKENLEFISGIYQIENKENKVNELIELFSLEEVKNKKAKNLSGGYKRRLSIAMALVNNPKILFLDEPTLGLDVLARRDLWKIISKIKKKATIILTTHYMEEAESIADHVGIIVKGKIKVIDTPSKLLKKYNAKTMEEAFIKVVEEEDDENK